MSGTACSSVLQHTLRACHTGACSRCAKRIICPCLPLPAHARARTLQDASTIPALASMDYRYLNRNHNTNNATKQPHHASQHGAAGHAQRTPPHPPPPPQHSQYLRAGQGGAGAFQVRVRV